MDKIKYRVFTFNESSRKFSKKNCNNAEIKLLLTTREVLKRIIDTDVSLEIRVK